MYLAKRAREVDASPTLAISSKAKEMQKEGIDIIGLGAGEPDFDTPLHIKKVAIEAIESGFTNYTSSSGIIELKEAISKKLKKDNDIEYNPEEIIVSSGAKHSLYNALQVICDEDDEIIVPAPYWVSYPQQIKLAGGKAVILETTEENDFKLKPEELSDLITDKTRGLILNTPSNPTGALYNKEELEKIAQIAVENDIYVIADEIYEKISYDQEAVSIASLNQSIKELTILVNGVSKAYAMTGWRIGYTAAKKEIIDAMSKLQSHSTSNPNSIAQKASVAALEGEQGPVEEMVEAFWERRDYIVNRIEQINGLSAVTPLGAFYLFVNAKDLIDKEIKGVKITDDEKLTEVLLTEAKVAVIPGCAFGAPGYLRLSYATSLEELTTALDRIEELLGSKN
jgi:aspartate aminotransferase